MEHDATFSDDPRPGGAGKVVAHEAAAHEKRNWVRLTYDCNNHCVFCLDTLAHNGTVRSGMDVKVQIVEGRKKGATRLILSGGEPTIHPQFLDFVKLGRRAGYRRVQTVTNGRMFAYPEFLERAAENGLDEITFSVHGHTAKLHDALVGTPGAFEQETAGLRAALASGRFIVNVDVVINKMNVKQLPEMLETFISWGVREFDLLQVIPFGNAWGKAREHLFYDLDGHEEVLARAFAISRRPDIHMWLNRFPPPYAEGFEELIQDPYKLNDEVRGRREEFDRFLSHGEKLHCRQPERCKHCYLEPLCDELDRVLADRIEPVVDVLELSEQSPRAELLPRARAVHVIASSAPAAAALAARAPEAELWLELPTLEALTGPALHGRPVTRVFLGDPRDVDRVLSWPGDVEIVVPLSKNMAEHLPRLVQLGARLLVQAPKYERVTDQREGDLDLHATCETLPTEVRSLDIPVCLGGRQPERIGKKLDARMLGADARLDMPRYTERFIADRFMTKSRRCKSCTHDATCAGVHINFVRAHGYAALRPIE
ncbi:MAG: radical SAM protein [Myxococcales bacterium]|nr:radical SAM protein [Myxococcales bacterium]